MFSISYIYPLCQVCIMVTLKGEEDSNSPPHQGEGEGGGGIIGSKCEMMCRFKICVFTGMTPKYVMPRSQLHQSYVPSLCPAADLWDTVSRKKGGQGGFGREGHRGNQL
jgi:hypothetical protein